MARILLPKRNLYEKQSSNNEAGAIIMHLTHSRKLYRGTCTQPSRAPAARIQTRTAGTPKETPR